MQTGDKVGQYSGVSNVASFGAEDALPPAQVIDVGINMDGDMTELSFVVTAVGDDGHKGAGEQMMLI